MVNPEMVISHRFPLMEIDKAMDVMGTPGRNKVVINPEKEREYGRHID